MDGSNFIHNNAPNPSTGWRWLQRYAEKHQLIRVHEFPRGITVPKKVRIYSRQAHYILQAWDPSVRRTVHQRVNGDLIDAIAKAREMEQRLVDLKCSGQGKKRLTHQELVRHYSEDLERRANAGEIAAATPARFSSALGHYLRFTAQNTITIKYVHTGLVDRQFVLDFSAYLEGLQISPNGHRQTPVRPMRGQGFVMDTVRAMFEWGVDPRRGNCLPSGFISPFVRATFDRRRVAPDLLREPDISLPMAADLLTVCKGEFLQIFALLVFYGLRAAEPVFIFGEFFRDDWLTVACIPEFGYRTKGARDKQLPLLPEIHQLLTASHRVDDGLLFVRRCEGPGGVKGLLAKASLQKLISEYQRRCLAENATTAARRTAVRNAVMQEAGAVTYKMIQGEFARVARELGWPQSATLKDLRHLFATCMSNGGMPEHERQYLMGHATSKAAILRYTHLNQLRQHHQYAVETQMEPMLMVLRQRLASEAPSSTPT